MRWADVFLFIIPLISTNLSTAQNVKQIPSHLPDQEQATFDIIVDNNPLGANFEIIGFIIENYGDESQFASIECYYHGDINKLRILDREIKIRLGYHFTNELVFSGETRNYSIKDITQMPPLFTIGCVGETTRKFPNNFNVGSALTLSRASSILESDLHINALKEVYGTIRITGTNSIFPDKMISLEGYTPDLNGIHKVSTLIHEFRENTWCTILKVGDDPLQQ